MSPVTDADTVRTRIPAAERRELVLDAAVIEFGDHGWHGARVEAIAARAGISHPYLMRISSKRNLFVDAMDRDRAASARERAWFPTGGVPAWLRKVTDG